MIKAIWILVLALFLPSLASAQQSRVVIDDNQVSTWATNNMDAMQLPSIAVGIVGPDKNHYLEIYGSPELHQPYLVGPLSQSVTAVAAMLLVSDGKLALDDPVRKWVSTAKEDVNVRDLLLHVSGLSRHDGWIEDGKTLEERVGAAAWNSPRGTFSYSDLNYQILGQIIEAVGGKPYGEFVHERVFEPLGMRQSHARSGHADNRVVGHQFMYGFTVTTGEPDYADVAIPATHVWMSANDMATWLRAHLTKGKIDGKQVLPQSVFDEVFTASPSGNAMGWISAERYDTPVLSYSGATGAFSAAMAVAPEREVGIFVLTNVNSLMALAPNGVLKGLLGSVLGSGQASTNNVEFWGRLGLGLIVALILLTLIFETLRWMREGFPLRLVGREALSVVITLVVNIAVIASVLVFVEIDARSMLTNQPDLAYGFLILTVGGTLRRLVTAFVKSKTMRLMDQD